MNLLKVAQKAEAITGDRAVGKPSPTMRPNGTSSITFRGSKGWYDVYEDPNEGLMVLFLEGQEKPTGKILGAYYTQPKPADVEAAKLVSLVLISVKVLKSVKSLPTFQYGYMSMDPKGVNWKRFAIGGKMLLVKTRRAGAKTYGEIIAGSLMVGVIISADGAIEKVGKIPSSRL
ncbi:MAG: hypothetical protein C4520_11920 [Candidatus Abyssobacteria bacterium SURF_5]|uniref:Uncharacterized protein n=1 Tax=Abyssobacteria bacterium (strain SURF_5) TaxID=2093360 RepID=A0A3A4NN77_ABYX5|nr:MAG: hypothetical protein C4520_11920 [Candidatus Abyssubacteria bacterium SURF_5]